MKSRGEFRVLFLLGNGHYHPNEVPQISFPLGPARLAARLRKHGYCTDILDAQAEGLLQVVLRAQTRSLGPFVGREPELVLHQHGAFDTVEVGLPDDELLHRVATSKPDIILATLSFTGQAGLLKRQIHSIRAQTSIPILIGGVAASMYPDLLGEYGELVFRGRFDDHIVDMMDAHRTGKGLDRFDKYRSEFASLEHSGGVIDVEGLEPNVFPVRRIPAALYEDAEAVFVERIAADGLEEVQKRYPYVISEDGELYFEGPIYSILLFSRSTQDLSEGLPAHVMTREGCVFSCEGCHISVEKRLGNSPGILCRQVDKVVEELEDLRRTGYSKIILGDDQALLPNEYLPELARATAHLGLEFYLPNGVLVNAIAKTDTQTLGTLMKAGFRSYWLPVESASQGILDQYWSKKLPFVLETTTTACRNLKAASLQVGLPIRVAAYFVIGHAGKRKARETLDEMYESICFARYLVDRDLVSYATFALYIPCPGTTSYENLLCWGMVIDPYAMIGGLYSVDGKGAYSPRSLEALRLAGWLFANHEETMSGRSSLNLEPNIDGDPHAHIDPTYRDYHLKRLEARYERFLTTVTASLSDVDA